MDEAILLSMKDFLARLRRDDRQKVHAPLADNYRKTGLMSDAEKMAKAGLAQYPSYLLCREVLGRIYYKQGKFDQAREQLEGVFRIIRSSIELSRILGKIYVKLGMPEQAREHLKLVVEKDPFDFEARNLLSELRAREEEADLEDEPEPAPSDLTDHKPSTLMFDIESIINSMEEPEVHDRKKYEIATDDTLDALESLEGVIDAKADELFEMSETEEQTEQSRPAHRMRRDLYAAREKEIEAAAMIGQIHMELHLLDEALIMARRMLAQNPYDQELKMLCAKFEEALLEKEGELDRLESMSIATGL